MNEKKAHSKPIPRNNTKDAKKLTTKTEVSPPVWPKSGSTLVLLEQAGTCEAFKSETLR